MLMASHSQRQKELKSLLLTSQITRLPWRMLQVKLNSLIRLPLGVSIASSILAATNWSSLWMGTLLALPQLLSQIRSSSLQFNIQLFRDLLSPLNLMARLSSLELLRTSVRVRMTTLFILQLMPASQNLAKNPLRSSSVLEESLVRSLSLSIAMANSTKTLASMKFQLMFPRTSISTSMETMKSVFTQLTIDLMLQLHGILAQLRSGIKKDMSKVLTMESKLSTSPFLPSTSPTHLRSLRSPQCSHSSAQPFSSSPSWSTSVTFLEPAVPTSLVCPSGACCSLWTCSWSWWSSLPSSLKWSWSQLYGSSCLYPLSPSS